jgi:hypothetical protein
VLRVLDPKRRRLIIVSRALWIPGLVIGTPYFLFNAYITVTSNYCCETPWANLQWMPLIVIFVIAMSTVLAGLILRRIIARASTSQNVLWLAAGIGWCGALSFGIGSAGSSFYPDSAFGGGEVTFYMLGLGILAIVIAIPVAIGGLIGALTDRAPTVRKPGDNPS